ncbi:MAG: hypothetical protein GC136_11390 [Alphaproteobacteria bacterium]|nr:hypothetical protein [Alphaproteobacteria bacterium]
MKDKVFYAIVCAIAFFSMASATPVFASNLNWQPYLVTEDVLFPSLILSTNNLDFDKILDRPQREDYLGDSAGLYGIKIKNPANDTKIFVTITIDGLSEASSYEGVLPVAGQEYTVVPSMRYKADALWKIKQPYPTTIIYSVTLNDAPPQKLTKKLSVRSVNDVPFGFMQNGKHYDTSLLFAAFVNENSPVIENILQDALEHNAVQSFNGYSGDRQQVLRQVFAIWNSLQRHGVQYSNIVTPSGLSKNIYSQHVRLPDESYDNSQANCVDGSVLIASALYKIGMCPVLVMRPGHMFLGVYNDRESCERRTLQNITFIETTAVGAVRLNALQKKWKFKTDDGYLSSVSYASLTDASNHATRQFNQMVPALNTKQKGYYLLDITQIRNAGIIPISSVISTEREVDTIVQEPHYPTPKQIIKGAGGSMIVQY